MEHKQVRADHDARTITVYQAYSPAVAEPALAAGRLVPPFRPDRMTWIKPSFLWTMYRCGWAGKPDQERVLAITVTREGFESALRSAVLSSERAERKPEVRVQWDPERDLHLNPLAHRAIQVGLAGSASHRYVREWTVGLRDVTHLAHAVHGLVRRGRTAEASALLPPERPYPLPPDVAERLGATG
ncbi:DUF4291 domain-containing protein [Umezawaea beigongshangensis]|uniref:DUF4291 domain-containing protein n=1 Tax=Umezawaea beigongshangensis TaxID=2780383 RepID=UPI0018F16319|nr:DUF4291 domain-containing protein [Umezawaea beigongshangensis]